MLDHVYSSAPVVDCSINPTVPQDKILGVGTILVLGESAHKPRIVYGVATW